MPILVAFVALALSGQVGKYHGLKSPNLETPAAKSLLGKREVLNAAGQFSQSASDPWKAYVKVGRRDSLQRVDFELSHPKRSYKLAHFEVFGDVGFNIKTGTPMLVNKVLEGPIGQSVSGPVFRIDFAALLRRTVNGQSAYNADLIQRLSQQGHISLYVRIQPDMVTSVSVRSKKVSATKPGARTMQARAKAGPLRMFQTEQEPSAYAVVEIGEPQPKSYQTWVEATCPLSGVKGWNSSAQLDKSTVIRWHTQALSAPKFIAQVNQTGFSSDWETWSAGGGSGGMQLQSQPTHPHEDVTFSASDLFVVLPQPAYTDRDYYVRIVPVNATGDLAGLPSNPVKISVPLYQFEGVGGKKTSPPAPSVHLKLESIDYRAENNQIDDTRFVIARDIPSSAFEYNIYAALSGQTPKKGVKFQIVPQNDDESMWDAISGAIGDAVGDAFSYATKLASFVNDVTTFLESFASILAGLPVAAIDAGTTYAMKSCGMPDSYIDKFEVLRRAPGFVAGHVLAVEEQAQEMSVGKARDAFFNTVTQLGQRQDQMNSLPEISPYIAQDPDFQYRPPTMFVKFKAVADKGAEGQFTTATSFSVSCTNFWEDASYQLTNGQPLTGQLVVIDSTAEVPAIPDGAEIVVPIYLSFASAQAQGDPNWGRAWYSPKTSQWQVWGNALDGSSAQSWVKNF